MKAFKVAWVLLVLFMFSLFGLIGSEVAATVPCTIPDNIPLVSNYYTPIESQRTGQSTTLEYAARGQASNTFLYKIEAMSEHRHGTGVINLTRNTRIDR